MDWLLYASTWYVMLLLIGVIFFPLTRRIFHTLYDQGYGFTKGIGILLLSYSMFVLGTIKVLPFTFFSLLLLLGLAIAFNYFLTRHRTHVKPLPLKTILFEEGLCFVAFFFWAAVRSREPSIHGLEKFMDFGFIQSALRGTYFPTKDMWLAGKTINYYYFGHITGAVLTKLSTIPAYITYNLILAQLFALSVVEVFSLGLSIGYTAFKKSLKFAFVTGALASFLVNLAGNLHAIYAFTTGYGSDKPVPVWTLPAKFIGQEIFNVELVWTKLPLGYWYPDATRFVPFTIHEFPIYSYVVADLHGHVFDIPFVLITITVLYVIFAHLKRSSLIISLKSLSQLFTAFKDDLSVTKGYLGYVIFLSFMMSIHLMTNAFDAPIYLLLSAFVLFVLFGLSTRFFLYIGVLIGGFVLFNLPFSTKFEPFSTGFGVNCLSANLTRTLHNVVQGTFLQNRIVFEGKCQSSVWWMLITLWGFFWFNALFLLAHATIKRFHISRTTVFMLMVCAFSTILILMPEFVYAKDIYPTHFRANTMFKLGYQAFIMMGIASAFTFANFKWHLKDLFSRFYILAFMPLFILVTVYPFFAINSYYGTDQRQLSFDGRSWMLTSYPEYYEIINYLQTHVRGQPTILEAQGDSYTDYNVVSAFTGLPTVAGWWVHQWLWRGDSQVVGRLIPEIEALYESNDFTLTRQLLQKYRIKYVIIGRNERGKYSTLQESKFEALGKAIFRSKSGSGIIFEIPLDSY